MKLGSKRVAIDGLEHFLAAKEYDKALAAITAELRRNPDQLNLRLRQADVLELKGDRTRAVHVLYGIAEAQARDGFYARAIAIYKKILRLDPAQEVHAELARLIEENQQSTIAAERRRKAGTALTEQASDDTEELKELQASSLFASFERETLVQILASTKLRSYDEGDIIVTEGEPGASLFLIVGGTVKVFTRAEDGANLPLAELGPGDFFGEVSLLTGKPRTATITAGTKVSAIELDRAAVDEIAREHPEVLTTLDDFCRQRAHQAVEAVIRRLRGKGRPPAARGSGA
jgi:tetratricopeptide (TPR) repeat protein